LGCIFVLYILFDWAVCFRFKKSVREFSALNPSLTCTPKRREETRRKDTTGQDRRIEEMTRHDMSREAKQKLEKTRQKQGKNKADR
jgi:hypothetical protein